MERPKEVEPKPPEGGREPQRLGPGAPLAAGAAARIAGALGVDLRGVRVHADARAARLADELGARAFTVGRDVGFAAGEYRPGTLDGDALLAHELAHAAQQRPAAEGAPGAGTKADRAGAEAEAEADRSAALAVATLHGVGGALTAGLDARPTARRGLTLQRCSAKKSLPPPRSHEKKLAKGIMHWELRGAYLESLPKEEQARYVPGNVALMQIWFEPTAPELNGKQVTFLQTLAESATGGTAEPKLDVLGGEFAPFYGAQWDAKTREWVADEVGKELAQRGYRNAPTGAGESKAWLFDAPWTAAERHQKMFESVAVVPETGETLGALRWGMADGKLLGAETSDCTDAPSAGFAPAVERFYETTYETILDGFAADDATLTPAHTTELDRLATKLKGGEDVRVLLGGYADSSEKDPVGISEKRALAVREYLVGKGVPRSHLRYADFGAAWARYRPSPSEARNRRVQILVRDATAEEVQAEPGGSGSSR